MKDNFEFNINNLESLYYNVGATNTLMQIYLKLCINSCQFENQEFRRGINEEDLVSIIKHSPASFLEFYEVMSSVAGVNIQSAQTNFSLKNKIAVSKFAEFCCKDNAGNCNLESQKLCEFAKKIIENESERKGLNVKEIKDYSILLDTLCATYDYSNDYVQMTANNLKPFPYRYFEDGETVFTRHSFKRRPRIETISTQNLKVKKFDKTLPEEWQEIFAEEEDAVGSIKANYSGRVEILKMQTRLGENEVKEMLNNVCYNLINGVAMVENSKKQDKE